MVTPQTPAGSLTYYNSVMVYTGQANTTPQLQYMLQPEGVIAREGSAYVYKYFNRDQVGSTRAVLAARRDGSGNPYMALEQTADFYPFGMAWGDIDNLNRNKYLYGGKELQDAEIGLLGMLNFYDSQARFYDPVLGRWFNPDPANQMANGYPYCGNNPMMFVDPDGQFFLLPALVIGAIIGAFTSAGAAVFNDGNMLKAFAVGALVGAISGVTGAWGGGLVGAGGGFWAGVASGALGGGFGGFSGGAANAWLNGASVGDGLIAGFKGAAIGAATGGAIGGLSRGIAAYKANTSFWTGKGTFDISNGIGATGSLPNAKKIDVVYRGRFEDTNIYESRSLGKVGFTLDNKIPGNWGAITLPEKGIFVPENSYGVYRMNNAVREMFQHEYGHILQYRILGQSAYYHFIGTESLASATLSDVTNGAWNHNTFWTETWANYLSDGYFGGESLMGGKYYPIERLSFGNALRISSYIMSTPKAQMEYMINKLLY